mmetsp:Transcript_126159/g.315347  ORF Transcript_126159/g.315347 Transcript_126159/m.315347 type:complete len:439 (-) Transcript_126159:93-1409(-)
MDPRAAEWLRQARACASAAHAGQQSAGFNPHTAPSSSHHLPQYPCAVNEGWQQGSAGPASPPSLPCTTNPQTAAGSHRLIPGNAHIAAAGSPGNCSGPPIDIDIADRNRHRMNVAAMPEQTSVTLAGLAARHLQKPCIEIQVPSSSGMAAQQVSTMPPTSQQQVGQSVDFGQPAMTGAARVVGATSPAAVRAAAPPQQLHYTGHMPFGPTAEGPISSPDVMPTPFRTGSLQRHDPADLLDPVATGSASSSSKPLGFRSAVTREPEAVAPPQPPLPAKLLASRSSSSSTSRASGLADSGAKQRVATRSTGTQTGSGLLVGDISWVHGRGYTAMPDSASAGYSPSYGCGGASSSSSTHRHYGCGSSPHAQDACGGGKGTKGPQDMPALGNEGHPDSCTPCAFFHYSIQGCNRFSACRYCHLSHPKKSRQRGKKSRTGDGG